MARYRTARSLGRGEQLYSDAALEAACDTTKERPRSSRVTAQTMSGTMWPQYDAEKLTVHKNIVLIADMFTQEDM